MRQFLAPALVFLCIVTACSAPEPRGGMASGAGMFKIGRPYTINGQRYTPRENYSYDETGIASWYGPGFAGRRTANGEIFDPSELTAAHPTLPMPSLVRVTNLDNGKSVVVRINDRGPFVAGRIIDLSRRAAELLGFKRAGIAKVRVSILAVESRAIANAARKRYRARGVRMAELTPPAREEFIPVSSPQAAPMRQVDAMPLKGPVPPSPAQPIANPSGRMIAAAKLAPEIPDPAPKSIPGKTVDGIFYPAPKVRRMKVSGGRRIFIQAGAFTVKRNAVRLRNRLAALGPAAITEADVKGRHFWRVRIGPVESVKEADRILAQVMGGGEKAARITVE